LQIAFLGLAISAIVLAGWQSIDGAASALRSTTFDRLAAIRDTRARELERYFHDVQNHVLALASDESTIRALEEFTLAWDTLPESSTTQDSQLRAYYTNAKIDPARVPDDARGRALQHQYLVSNPNPPDAKDRLLAGPGRYGEIHRRYHPTLHRYQSAFGFYDILLVGGSSEARVLYSVFKETDLGMKLTNPAFVDTGLAAVYREAMRLQEPERFVVRDFSRYVPSHGVPAAFVASPVWRSGARIGVLAIQVSITEIDRVMSGEMQGLGATGQAYLVGADGFLRSDLRFREAAETAVLSVKARPEIAALARSEAGTEAGGQSVYGRPGATVLRSHKRPRIEGLDWGVFVEIDEAEAFAPVFEMRRRILLSGLLIAGVFLIAAAWLARSVTRPVIALRESVRRLAARDFQTRVDLDSNDELGELAAAFNRMAHELERTTVSKEELEKLAGKLIHAQEEERRKIARELHDDVTQRMAATAIEAGALAASQSADPERLREGVQRIREKIAKLADDIHGLSRSLHPAMLDELGLPAAVESECRASFERGGPPVDSEVEGEFEDLSRDVRLTLLRIVQESLRNINRHAAAEQVTLRLSREPATNAALLMVQDDGRGFDKDSPQWRAGLGLASMEERVRLVGGTWSVETALGKGTTIRVRLPANAS